MSGKQEWAAVAIVLRPHALRGVLVLKPLTTTLDEFLEAPLERLMARRNGKDVRELVIESMTVHKGLPHVQFEGISDRNMAETLLGCELAIPAEERWELAEGAHYTDELEGLEVVDEISNTSYGKVLRAENGNAHDYLIFPHPANPKREVLLPMVPDFVRNIDTAARRITVRLPEGLLDL